ncbi:MAG TPA: filamentous hemagglutinin N-terminal domain-containing protein [Tepidisphaeraceae bacterium]
MSRRSFVRHVAAVVAIGACAADVRAASPPVRTDATLGRAARTIAPSRDGVTRVPAGVGRRAGDNLFHSFERFDVPRGGVRLGAPADGPPLARVLARVTGPDATRVTGPLVSDVAGADFFLINPNGILIGPGGRVLSGGGVFLTTANEARFPGGEVFSATEPEPAGDVLSSRPPTSFGFLGGGPIVNRGGSVRAAPGRVLGLLAGGVTLRDGAEAAALSGRLEIASVAGPGAVGFDGLTLSVPTGMPRADVILDGTATARRPLVGVTGGRAPIESGVRVQGRDLSMRAAILTADNSGSAARPAVSIELTGTLRMQDAALILSRRDLPETAGPVRIEAAVIDVDGGGGEGATGVLVDRVRFADTVPAIDAHAGRVSLRDGGRLASITSGEGASGGVLLTAARLDIAGTRAALISQARTGSTGGVGDVSVVAHDVSVRRGGAIASLTEGAGGGGTIRIAARHIALAGEGFAGFTGIGATAQPGQASAEAGASMTGAAGDVTIGRPDRPVTTLEIASGAGVSVKSFTRGRAGTIDVYVRSLSADGRGAGIEGGTTGLRSSADVIPGAAGGSVRLFGVESLHLDHAEIGAKALGDGGNVLIDAVGKIVLTDSTIQAAAGDDGGNVGIDAGAVSLNRSVIDGRFDLNQTRGDAAQPVRVEIARRAVFLRSIDSTILARDPLLPPDVDLSSSLVGINTVPLAGVQGLLPNCFDQAQKSGSSFSVDTAGGLRE